MDIRLLFAYDDFLIVFRSIAQPSKRTNCNRVSEKEEFRNGFPRYLPTIHKGSARTINFALVGSPPERIQRHNLNGHH
jgi:hypothetical protein